MAITALAGKSGWFKIAGTSYPQRDWTLQLTCARIDVTNFLSGGFSETIAGFASGTVRTRGILDPSFPQLTLGQALTLDLGIGGGYKVSFSGILLNLTASTAVDKAGEVEFEIGTNGAFSTTFAVS